MSEDDLARALKHLHETVEKKRNRAESFRTKNGVSVDVRWRENGVTEVLLSSDGGYSLQTNIDQFTGEALSQQYLDSEGSYLAVESGALNPEATSEIAFLTNELARLWTDPTGPLELPLRLRPEVIDEAGYMTAQRDAGLY